MKFISRLFAGSKKSAASSKFSDNWLAKFAEEPDWLLHNIVNNTGEFTKQKRAAAATLLKQRK